MMDRFLPTARACSYDDSYYPFENGLGAHVFA